MIEQLENITGLDWRECKESGQLVANGSNSTYWVTIEKNGALLIVEKIWSIMDKKFNTITALTNHINNREFIHAN